jgi:hypothetical protein
LAGVLANGRNLAAGTASADRVAIDAFTPW